MTAAKTTTRAMMSEKRGTNRAVCITVCSHAVLDEAGVMEALLTLGPRSKSCSKVSTRSTITSPSFRLRMKDQDSGCVNAIPRCARSMGPVVNNRPMATQATMRNRLAADRKRAINSGAALRLFTIGARTKERKIIPPIQLIAAKI